MEDKSLHELTIDLTEVAMGRKAADSVIKNAKLINVNTAEIIENTDIAIYDGRIAFVGKDANHTINSNTQTVDATGYYACPGFLDGHIHVESSMVTVSQFAKAVLPLGTTGIFMDPHEIANVFGVSGVKLMDEEGKKVPLKVFTTVPSCVPSALGLEDSGSILDTDDIKDVLSWPTVSGLGEMMNFPGVFNADKDVHERLKATLLAEKVITGHFALQDTGKELQAYAAAGCSSCHESTRKEDVVTKMRLGMYAMIREGSAWHDVKETIKSITETKIDSRFCLLVSDDTHPETLLTKGHLNHVVRRAIEEGLNPIQAIQMVTINTAQYFNKDRDLGSISPGKCADILLLKDLTKVIVSKVFVNGELLAEEGDIKKDIPNYKYPDEFKNSVHIKKKLTIEDFKIEAPQKENFSVKVRAIEIEEAQVLTKSIQVELPVKNGLVYTSIEKDTAKISCIERHKGSGSMSLGFVRGFGLLNGAVASTVAHDSHNLLIIGTNDEDMSLAGNTLAEVGGGLVVVKEGEVLALLPLPIAGLMSDKPIIEVRDKVEEIYEGWRTLGCRLESPFMTMALLSLPVIPKLRITNRGLVDVDKFQFTDLFV